jgi:hypothetical protein
MAWASKRSAAFSAACYQISIVHQQLIGTDLLLLHLVDGGSQLNHFVLQALAFPIDPLSE